MMSCDFCGTECLQKEIRGQEFEICEDYPVMNFTAEQIQIASIIDTDVQALSSVGCDDAMSVGELLDYMPGFKRLMNTSQRNEMDEPCRRLQWFYRYAKILESVAVTVAEEQT
jgi:ssDNA-binding Zn-finger/Zn-ribbon topoisomerase 1